MTIALAFDVYGTLIDPLATAVTLRNYLGDDAAEFAKVWRDKQLEYTFRRGLMEAYEDFSICTRDALEFASRQLQSELSAEAKAELLDQYQSLPAYPEVLDELQRLRSAGCRMYAFSNGVPEDLHKLLGYAGIADHLDGVVSVHDVRSFKPDPAVYAHFLNQVGADAKDTWLISGNAFDVIGARHAEWRAVWLQRNREAVFDPWGIEPTATIHTLGELHRLVVEAARN